MTGAGIWRSRVVIAVACTALQLCFGTVYAWSFFQTLLVRQEGWTFTETAVAFSLAIFTLGVSAVWAGRVLSRTGPRKLALAGSGAVLRWIPGRGGGAPVGPGLAVLARLRGDRRSRDREWAM